MSASRDPDRLIEAFLLKGPERLQDRVYDAVRADIDMKRQRVVIGSWKLPTMNKLAPIGVGAAVVFGVLLLGSRLLSPPSRPGGPGATPSPSPALLARGQFVFGGEWKVELAATGEGSSVTGSMSVWDGDATWDGEAAFTVELQCTRTTDDGLIMIGGYTIDTAGDGSNLSPEGTPAAIVLKRGSPVQARIWAQRGADTSRAGSCLAYLDEQLQGQRGASPDDRWLTPVQGTIELGP